MFVQYGIDTLRHYGGYTRICQYNESYTIAMTNDWRAGRSLGLVRFGAGSCFFDDNPCCRWWEGDHPSAFFQPDTPVVVLNGARQTGKSTLAQVGGRMPL